MKVQVDTSFMETNPGILGGKPVFAGTRLSVEHVLQCIEDGWKHEELLHEFPVLNENHLMGLYHWVAANFSYKKALSSYAKAAVAG